MPVVKAVGFSPATQYKQFALNSALGHILGACKEVANKRQVPYVIGDMTAGPGCDPSGLAGSPLIFAEHISGMIERGLNVHLICVEREREHLDTLRGVLSERYSHVPVEYYSDQASALASVPKNAVGLTYWDPTRYNDLDKVLLSQFGRSHYFMDILITRECLAGYRMQRAAHCAGTLAIQDYLALTGKRCNYIMPYAKHGWWAFGFADNWVERSGKKLKGFVNVESDEGRMLYSRWTDGIEFVPPAVLAQPKEQSLW